MLLAGDGITRAALSEAGNRHAWARHRRGHAKRRHHARERRPPLHRKAISLSRDHHADLRRTCSRFSLHRWYSVAAGVLYPLFGLLLSPFIAGAAMS